MHLGNYLKLIHHAELDLADACRHVARDHADEADVSILCRLFAEEAEEHARKIESFAGKYGEDAPEEPERLRSELFQGTRKGGLGLLRDLHDLYLMATEVDISWTMIEMAAQGVRDKDLLEVVKACDGETEIQLAWLRTRLKEGAPQALIVAA